MQNKGSRVAYFIIGLYFLVLETKWVLRSRLWDSSFYKISLIGLVIGAIGLILLRKWAPYLIYIVFFVWKIIFSRFSLLVIGALFLVQLLEAYTNKEETFYGKLSHPWQVAWSSALIFGILDLILYHYFTHLTFSAQAGPSYISMMITGFSHMLFSPFCWLRVLMGEGINDFHLLDRCPMGTSIFFALMGLLVGKFLLSRIKVDHKKIIIFQLFSFIMTFFLIQAIGFVILLPIFSLG